MEEVVNIHEAKTHLSRLIVRVMGGEEVVIAKAGTPVARLVPYEAAPQKREPGSAQGAVQIEPDFDDPLPDELLESFER